MLLSLYTGSLPIRREAKRLGFTPSHFIPHGILCPDCSMYVSRTNGLVLVVYNISPCPAGLGSNWDLRDINVFCLFPQISLRGTSANTCRLFVPSPLPFLTAGAGWGLSPQLAAHHLQSRRWKLVFHTKWHGGFLDSFSLTSGRCFPALGLSRFTAHLQSSWSFSVILAGKLHSFPFLRNSGLWLVVSPSKRASQGTSGWA